MFTGIIEDFGTITQIEKERENVHVSLESNITPELKIDQSVAHNGVCLTVVKIDGNRYTVTAIKETIDKTNLSEWKVGDKVNLERAMQLGARLDGHIVQGHVDQIGQCTSVKEEGGSWVFDFEYEFIEITINTISIMFNINRISFMLYLSSFFNLLSN